MRNCRQPIDAALFEETADDLYEHAPCGYLSLFPDGVVAKANTTFLEWVGLAKDAVVGTLRFHDLLTVGGRIYYETHFQPLLRMQGFVREIAFDLTCHDGARLPVLVNATQRDFGAGGVITRITVFDATDRRRYERELLAARRRAEEEAQAKADLIAMISHDVRSPLSAITMAIALLERSSPTPQQMEFIRVLQSSTTRALELVNNVLDLSRLESGRTPLREREFTVRGLVEEIVAAARAAAVKKPDLAITAQVDDGVPDRLIGDRPKLGQVLANLMMNAVKFTAEGFVTLTVGVRDTTNDTVTLDVLVSDSGIGIPPDRLPYIFDEYTQANDEIADKYGGSGLGLAISRKLLQMYRSDIHVTSAVGQGTTFSFALTLRRAEEAPREVAQPLITV
jgi:PAS domain S-box-containing protein